MLQEQEKSLREDGGPETAVYVSLAAGAVIVVAVCALFCSLDRQVLSRSVAINCSLSITKFKTKMPRLNYRRG